MSGKGKGEVNGGDGKEAPAIIPLPTDPPQPFQPITNPDPSLTTPNLTQPIFPTEFTSFVTAAPSTLATLTEVVTITKSDRRLSAQSTVIPKKTATVTSIISDVSSAQENNTSTVNISAIILGIMVGLVIVGGSIVILIRKFSKNKENKKNQSQRTSINVNVHNNVPNAELSELDNQMPHRGSLIYFQPQFPIPPPRPQIPLPQHSPQILQHSPQNPPVALYAGVNPNYYQKYSQIRPPTATGVTSSNSEQSQISSTEIPD